MFMDVVYGILVSFIVVAKAGVEEARNSVAQMINAEPSEILFLSGGRLKGLVLIVGSESINQALIGGIRALHDDRRTIIASCFEHPAVNETLRYIFIVILILRFLKEEYGFTILHLQVNRYGFVDADELEKLLSSDVAMVTCMLANNEIGSIQPIAEMVKRVRAFESSFSPSC